ncbi:MAG: (2Fe-2S)-binding protein [Deltaproteobacteria bacterium]|jgi:predicted molibdopterin-dependent oxidoreductase YjgC|nr:(2Fe-2S)-binding protein [Deltaproteobacteria bacterium]
MPGDFKAQNGNIQPRSNPDGEAIFFTLNGQRTQGRFGQTLLEAIRPHNKIPALCGEMIPGLGGPCSACGLSVVEISGREELVQACATPLEEGLEVMTFSGSVRRSRVLALKELAKRHQGNCLVCERSGSCQLQTICADQGLALLSQPRPNPEFTLLAAVTMTGADQTAPLGKNDSAKPLGEDPEALSLRAEFSLVGRPDRKVAAPSPISRVRP